MKDKYSEKAILILSDMEGVSGLIDKRLVRSGEPFWQGYGRHLLTEDINAIANEFENAILMNFRGEIWKK